MKSSRINFPEFKKCSKCGKNFPCTTEYFYHRKQGKYGFMAVCKKCRIKKEKEWRVNNPDKVKKTSKKHYIKMKLIDPAYQSRYVKKVRDDIRKQLFDGYGGKCACCGETHYEFLSLDHRFGGGTTHRELVNDKSSYRTINLYRSIIKDGFPDIYQILCFNCHFAKDSYGKCPHGNVVREYDRYANSSKSKYHKDDV